jgi:hypothetical protein
MRRKGNSGSRSRAENKVKSSRNCVLDSDFRGNDCRGIPPGRGAPTKGPSGHAYFTACPEET